MTTTEAWQIITDCTVNGDWTGVLVGADALSEAGDEETAISLRWLLKMRSYPNRHLTYWHLEFTGDHYTKTQLYAPTLKDIWLKGVEWHQRGIRFYQ